METLYFLLYLLAALCFVGAALGRGVVAGKGDHDGARRGGVAALGLLPLGLFFWVLVPFLETARDLF